MNSCNLVFVLIKPYWLTGRKIPSYLQLGFQTTHAHHNLSSHKAPPPVGDVSRYKGSIRNTTSEATRYRHAQI